MGNNENSSFTEVTSQSWFSRMGQSIKSVGLGLLIFIAAFPVLWINEGSAVRTAKGLTEGKSKTISLKETTVNAANDGKLVHLTGKAETSEIINDPVLGISENAIRIVRSVKMYQWRERTSSKTEKKLGGGTETRKEYRYVKEWSSTVVNSSNFRRPGGHQNPAVMEVQDGSIAARNVTLGDFSLPPSLVSQISSGEKVQFTQEMISSLPYNLQGRAQASGNELYIGYSPSSPQVGDLKISVTIVRPQTVSIVAQQQGNSFTSYQTEQGTSIMMLSSGTVTAPQMFASAEASNTMWTWIKRGIGFLMMFIGLTMIFKPVVTLGDVVPIVGSILNFGIGFFSFVVALALSIVVIAIAWIAYRPILGGILLAAGIGAFVAFKVIGNKKKAAA